MCENSIQLEPKLQNQSNNFNKSKNPQIQSRTLISKTPIRKTNSNLWFELQTANKLNHNDWIHSIYSEITTSKLQFDQLAI